MINRLINH